MVDPVADRAAHPCSGFVSIARVSRGTCRRVTCQRIRFVRKTPGSVFTILVALPDSNNDLAFARLGHTQPMVAPVLAQIGRLFASTEIAAVVPTSGRSVH